MAKNIPKNRASSQRQREERKQHRQKAEKTLKPTTTVREWIDTIVFALVGVLIIRNMLFGFFVVPTPSMESEVLSDEYIVASNLHYGPRLPMTLGIPFTSISFDALSFPYFRLPGFGSIQRGDVVVFNVPFENKPVDYKTPYLKRLIGMPGDTLQVIDKIPQINGKPIPLKSTMQVRWNIVYADSSTETTGVLTKPAVEQFAHSRGKEVLSVTPAVDGVARGDTFPHGVPNTFDNYGPLYIPKKGDKITLTDANWSQYHDVITKYEGQSLKTLGNNKFEINGENTNIYTIKQNYYFMMGDNRDNSLDSRAWGYVPEDHVVAKAIVVLFSWDTTKGISGVRFSKWFRRIHDGITD